MSAENDLSGIYHFTLKLTSPQLIARHFDKIVASYLRGGTVVVKVEPQHRSAELSGWTGVNLPIWKGCLSGFEVVLYSTGIQGLESQLRELSEGCIDGDFRWR